MNKTYIGTTTTRAARARSKRLREAGYGSGSVAAQRAAGTSGGSDDNGWAERAGYAERATYAERASEATEAGHAAAADEALHADSADEALHASAADEASVAGRLSGNTAYTVWGRTFWEDGQPKDVTGNLDQVGNIDMTGALILHGTGMGIASNGNATLNNIGASNIGLSGVLDIGTFATGLLGSGGTFRMKDGKSYLETDELYVRMRAYFDTLEIRRYIHSGGNRVASAAGCKVSRVEWYANDTAQGDPLDQSVDGNRSLVKTFRCYFKKTDGDNTITNDFALGDLACCKTTNLSGSNQNTELNQKYYWRRVVSYGVKGEEHYIVLSNMSGKFDGTDFPEAEDDIVQLGSATNLGRQGAIIEAVSGGVQAPTYRIYQGISGFSLAGKCKIDMGYDTGTHKAYLNVYGDFYVGEEGNNPGSYIRYSQTGGANGTPLLEIKAKIDASSPVGTGGLTLNGYITNIANNYATSALNNAKTYADGKINDYEYLKDALEDGDTIIHGGLILSNIIALQNDDNVVTAGITGLSTNNNDIALWLGGPMADIENPVTGQLSFAKSLFRFDGSGYLAGGNISWDDEGDTEVKGTIRADNLYHNVCVFREGGTYSNGGQTTGNADIVFAVPASFRTSWARTRNKNATGENAGYSQQEIAGRTIVLPSPSGNNIGKVVEVFMYSFGDSDGADPSTGIGIEKNIYIKATGQAPLVASFHYSDANSRLEADASTDVINQPPSVGYLRFYATEMYLGGSMKGVWIVSTGNGSGGGITIENATVTDGASETTIRNMISSALGSGDTEVIRREEFEDEIDALASALSDCVTTSDAQSFFMLTSERGNYLPLSGGTLQQGATITLQETVDNNAVSTLVASQRWVSAQGYQTNAIETVKVDNVALAVSNKAVNIDLTGYQQKLLVYDLKQPVYTDEYVGYNFETIYAPIKSTRTKNGRFCIELDYLQSVPDTYATKTWANGRFLPLSAGSDKPLTGSLYWSVANQTDNLIISNNKIQLSVSGFPCNVVEFGGSTQNSTSYAKFYERPQVKTGTNTYTNVALVSDLSDVSGKQDKITIHDTITGNNTDTWSTLYAPVKSSGTGNVELAYLPLSGGTLTGSLSIGANTLSFSDSSNGGSISMTNGALFIGGNQLGIYSDGAVDIGGSRINFFARPRVQTGTNNGTPVFSNVALVGEDIPRSWKPALLSPASAGGAVAISSGADLDEFQTSGTYYCTDSTVASSLSHCPYSAGNFRLFISVNTGTEGRGNNWWGQQIIITGNALGAIYTRSHSGKVWYSWKRLWDFPILNTKNGGAQVADTAFTDLSLPLSISTGHAVLDLSDYVTINAMNTALAGYLPFDTYGNVNLPSGTNGRKLWLASVGSVNFNAATGGWAAAWQARTNAGSGTSLGGWGFYGVNDTLTYLYAGAAYNDTWLKISPAGNVAIGLSGNSGTAVPSGSYKLDVYGDIHTSADIRLDNERFIYFKDNGGTFQDALSHGYDSNDGEDILYVGFGYNSTDYATEIYGRQIRFFSGAGSTPRLAINGSRVGIGVIPTNSSSYKLEVAGSVKLDGLLIGVTNIDGLLSFDSTNSKVTAGTLEVTDLRAGISGYQMIIESDDEGVRFTNSSDGYSFDDTIFGSSATFSGDVTVGSSSSGKVTIGDLNVTFGSGDVNFKSKSNPSGGMRSYNFDGPVYARGTLLSSDISQKDVVRYLEPSVQEIANAPVIEFSWKTDAGKELQLGSIAQYWEKVLPEAVKPAPNGTLSMNYDAVALASAITAARKALDNERRIAELEHRVRELEGLLTEQNSNAV